MAYPDYPSNVVPALAIGFPIIMPQTTVHALPASAHVIMSTNTNMQISPDGTNGFQTIAAMTLGTTLSGGGFIRSVGSTATVILQRAW